MILLPINNVLFPGSKLKLIFTMQEQIKLIKKAYFFNEKVLLLNKRFLFVGSIGCISEILDAHFFDDIQKCEILFVGLRRARIKEIKEIAPNENIAIFEDFVETDSEPSLSLYKELEILLKKLFEETYIQIDPKYFEYLKQAEYKSYKIAEKAGLTMEQRQQLLEIQGENERLHYLLKHIETLKASITPEIKARILIMNDGYLI